MAQSTFSLAWDLHKNNICNGLSILQQNEEFVDMTLAADGHHVKVHQMVLALASPYIKQLITSAACPHPVIFLNKITYQTLSLILEYIYTGEVLVSMENLRDLVQAAKELHIKGLEDMDIEGSIKSSIRNKMHMSNTSPMGEVDSEGAYFEVTISEKNTPSSQSMEYTIMEEELPEESECMMQVQDEESLPEEITSDLTPPPAARRVSSTHHSTAPRQQSLPSTMQFTVSNQGSLQMILNRYMYYLKHCNKNNTRQWRCVDYLNSRKCPALVVTRENMVVQRISAHSHPFHDKRILKKVYASAVFAAIHEAEKKGLSLQNKSKVAKNENTTSEGPDFES